ncbi:hypothetical protein BGE01nite_35780 [Brevifollis gellanilyticus]|uniref:Uncharacterized protein n=1 Tax=Brevifollis gellanilyticus TaxID=748831 RepID=A0A512MC37_9BACT|nr:hypothetical protein BGE01nite_35780 [Brevifollis gellanilyticus]
MPVFEHVCHFFINAIQEAKTVSDVFDAKIECRRNAFKGESILHRSEDHFVRSCQGFGAEDHGGLF